MEQIRYSQNGVMSQLLEESTDSRYNTNICQGPDVQYTGSPLDRYVGIQMVHRQSPGRIDNSRIFPLRLGLRPFMQVMMSPCYWYHPLCNRHHQAPHDQEVLRCSP